MNATICPELFFFSFFKAGHFLFLHKIKKYFNHEVGKLQFFKKKCVFLSCQFQQLM